MKDATGPIDRPPGGRFRGRVLAAIKTVALLAAAGVPMALAIDRNNERPRLGHRRTRLTFAVLDAETGGAVAGARVRVYWPALWVPDRVEEIVGTTGRDGRTSLPLHCRTVTSEGLFHSRGVLVYPQAYLAVTAEGFEPSEPCWLSERTGRSRDLSDPEPPPVRLILRRQRPGAPGRGPIAGQGDRPRGAAGWYRGAHPASELRPGPWRISARAFAETASEGRPDPPAPARPLNAEK
jgi:hypothetical protein